MWYPLLQPAQPEQCSCNPSVVEKRLLGGETASFRPQQPGGMLPFWFGVEGFCGIPWSPTMLGVHWVQEQEEGGSNSEPCKTPLHPAKSTSTLHEWPTFLWVSVSMENTAMGVRRLPGTEHQVMLRHLPLPSRDTRQTSQGTICSRDAASKHPPPGPQSSQSPPRARSPAGCMGSAGPACLLEKEHTWRLFPQAHSPQLQGVRWAAGSRSWATTHRVPPFPAKLHFQSQLCLIK